MMRLQQFRDRREAGRQLAAKLGKYAHRPDVLVLGLPRGGVPVAYEIAGELGLPLDILLVRKLGVPGERELAMGAVASGSVTLLNQRVIQALRIPGNVIEDVALQEQRELIRRERLYRGDSLEPVVSGWEVIIVDDGIATGSTVRAALLAVERKQPGRTIVASPVIAADTFSALQSECDEVVCLLAPEDFLSVGSFYSEFPQTADDEIQLLLSLDRQRRQAHGDEPPTDHLSS